jgi:hypothetical protein
MNRFTLLSVSLIVFGCNQTDRESLKDYIEFKIDSQNYVRWSKDQKISWDIFNNKPNGDGSYDAYFGTYFYWDFDENNVFKFNATVYFDREKSWVKGKDEWGDNEIYYNDIPELLKLKFDYHEYVTRQFRKELVESGKHKTDEELRELSIRFFNRAEKEWNELQQNLLNNFSVVTMHDIRQVMDVKLNALKDFDDSLNSVFN